MEKTIMKIVFRRPKHTVRYTDLASARFQGLWDA